MPRSTFLLNEMKQKVYIGSIPGNLSDADVLAYFTKLVSVCEFILVKPKDNPMVNKGYGFLTVESPEDCDIILSRQHYLAGRRIKCEALEKGSKLKQKRKNLFARRIFISNVPSYMDNQAIEEIFSKLGEVESAYKISIQSSNRGSGFGYVTFYDEEPARALIKMGKLVHQGATLSIRPYDQTKAGQTKDTKHDIGNRPDGPMNGHAEVNPAKTGTRLTASYGNSAEETLSEGKEAKGAKVTNSRASNSTTKPGAIATGTPTSDYKEVSKPTSKRYCLERRCVHLDHKPSNLAIRLERVGNSVAL